MGRAGFEPATSGLRVRLDELKRAVRNQNVLQLARTVAATSVDKMQVTETSLYVSLSPMRATLTSNPLQLVSGDDARREEPLGDMGCFGSFTARRPRRCAPALVATRLIGSAEDWKLTTPHACPGVLCTAIHSAIPG